MGGPPRHDTLHASCVSLDQNAVLILGASGAGKSGLALQLMALGAALIADDRTVLTRRDDVVMASCPPTLSGMIEARHVGILAADPAPPAPVRLVVDLNVDETDRLPPFREVTLLGCKVNLLHRAAHAHFPSAILQYLKGGRRA